MALTMTRTRTQTTLSKLAELVASVHGELAFVEELLNRVPADEARVGIERRHRELVASRDALYLTVRQFDPELDPASIGMSEEWLKPFGRGMAGRRRAAQHLLQTELRGSVNRSQFTPLSSVRSASRLDAK